MKKYLGLFLVLVMVLIVGTKVTRAISPLPDNNLPVLPAQSIKPGEGDNKIPVGGFMTQGVASLRIDAQLKMDNLKTKIAAEKNSITAKLELLRITMRGQALEKFDQAIERISGLDDDVNAKIADLEIKGVATIDGKNFATTAETSLSDAKNKITEINTLLGTSVSEITSADKTNLKTLTEDTQTLLKEAHQALSSAVKSLKNAVQTKIEAGTTTDATAPAAAADTKNQ